MKIFVACLSKVVYERVYARKVTMSAYSTLAAMSQTPLELKMVWDLTNWDRYFPSDETIGDDEFYVLSDDDVVPCEPAFFDKALEIMKAHPEIGALGFPAKPRLHKSEVEGYYRGELAAFPRLWDFDHFGGIRIVRKGVVTKPSVRPKDAEQNADRIFCQLVRDNGLVCALAPDLWFHHLGETFTTLQMQ